MITIGDRSHKRLRGILAGIFIILTLGVHILWPGSAHLVQAEDSSDPYVLPDVELGKKIYEEIKTKLEFTENPLIQVYVDRLGQKISSNLPPHRFEFRYFIIKSDQLNAFALPNGYIFFTERLLNSVTYEDELVFVLSHETAHVTQMHLRKLMEKKSKIDIATMAAMVAGLLLAKDNELQTAIEAFSIGTNQSFFLKYSREFEDEADEVGFNYLLKAGYSGRGAVEFMEKLHHLERITIVPPAYLSTHPATNSRISHLERLNKWKTHSDPSLTKPTSEFRRFKIWNRLETEHPNNYLKNLQKEYLENPNQVDIIYGLALAYEKVGKKEEALHNFQKSLNLNPHDSDIRRDLGIFLFRHGKYKEAEESLQEAARINPGDFLAFHYLGRTLKEENQTDKAIANLVKSKELQSDFPENYYFLGSLYQKKNQLKEAHQNFGTHFSLKGNKIAAEFHFQEAKKY